MGKEGLTTGNNEVPGPGIQEALPGGSSEQDGSRYSIILTPPSPQQSSLALSWALPKALGAVPPSLY